jgi:hypothetical protein
MISNVAEIILPADPGTPGAIGVHCPEFVDILVRDCLSSTEQKKFREGLQTLNDDFQDSKHTSLTATISDDMKRYFEDLDYNSFNGHDTSINQTFRWLKQMVILGYYSSESVMRNQLDYHAIPGKYIGCIKIDHEAKAYVDDNVVG